MDETIYYYWCGFRTIVCRGRGSKPHEWYTRSSKYRVMLESNMTAPELQPNAFTISLRKRHAYFKIKLNGLYVVLIVLGINYKMLIWLLLVLRGLKYSNVYDWIHTNVTKCWWWFHPNFSSRLFSAKPFNFYFSSVNVSASPLPHFSPPRSSFSPSQSRETKLLGNPLSKYTRVFPNLVCKYS